MHNPSLREEPWGGPATVVPMTDTVSILDWLRQQGRLIDRTTTPTDLDAASPPEEDISLLMGEEEADDDAFEDGGFDDDDED
jgi:hypothetical protein